MTDVAPKPSWDPLHLRCSHCGYDWQDWAPYHVPVDTWIAHVRALTCLHCGADSDQLLIRRRPAPEVHPAAAHVGQRG
jgi:hypothetical protein